MGDLIEIKTNDKLEQLVSARDLHEILGVKTAYKDWFPRMCSYGFKENEDFVLVAQKRATNNPKNPVTEVNDHIIKLDMAKEIAMIQRTKKGKEIREYFIQVEKEWNSPEKVMARALIFSNNKINLLQEQNNQLLLENKMSEQMINELKPKADYTDIILKNKSTVTITQIAKDYGMSGQKMNKILADLRVQYKLGTQWLLYSKYQSEGYTHSQTINITRADGRPDITMETKWTQKGRLFLYNFLKEKEILPVIEREL